ncbi:glycosyltransferase [Wenyingzhuangia aestuarii]|uniref:glycosyltransferase n=1 Tax=Wenyingzhuangia aestuarii TaxID=1647582 RepID=UPI00143C5460|nr:glycosyltransferase [Wenyingzhuangia aestuarii]NJB83253.1 glycosyltransferase involved in cell wall biosynthesis [Wenyingzhuangia aestuarii]
MKYIFWQNTNSIHQVAFFEALAKTSNDLVLIVTMPITERRKAMGWKEPDLKNVKVKKAYKKDFNIKDFISANSDENTVHVFSGINAFPLVHKAFKYTIKTKCKIGIFTEPLDYRGWKGTLRYVRGFIHRLKWGNRIDFVLTTGKLGVKQFYEWKYKPDKIFEWGYTVTNSKSEVQQKVTNSSYKIMFAGSLIMRKGYDILIEALKKITNNDYIADFYCLSDSELNDADKIVNNSGLKGKLNLLPFLPNEVLRKKMNDYDLFVLPSRHDGWGAVVSESITEGTPVVVSYKCGASCQVNMQYNIGVVVNSLDDIMLSKSIDKMINLGKVTAQRRKEIRTWAENHISGSVMAAYFTDIVKYVNKRGNDTTKPTAPWY